MLTLSCIGESGSLLSTSVQCFYCLSFSKVLHMEYICLCVLVPQEKKKREEIKKKNHKEINKHLLFPDLQLFGLRSACRQSQNKNPWMSICLHRFLLTCMRVFKILFYIYFISFHLTLSQSGPFTFCYFTALDLFSPMYISSFPICHNFVGHSLLYSVKTLSIIFQALSLSDLITCIYLSVHCILIGI